MLDADIENRFSFHPADTDAKRETHEAIRANCKSMAYYLNSFLPEGREKSLAITHLEEVMFWSNAAVARQA
jgi:hypothetical protein